MAYQMSLAITHFTVGASLTTLVVWATGVGASYRLTLAVGGGLWALVPDLHYVLPPAYAARAAGLDQTALGDLFWFHATLDGIVIGRGTRLGAAVGLCLLLSVASAVEWRNGRGGLVHDSGERRGRID